VPLACEKLKEQLKHHLDELKELSAEQLVEQRYEKFRAMTIVAEGKSEE
jgi:acetyl-CoA carboxylase carboxyl transferase subunit alpha